MTTSAISGSTPSYQPLTQPSDFRQEFRQLAEAIKAGDLSGAQQAYGALTQAQGPGASVTTGNSPIAKALSGIGQALQNGDIRAAQQTLASLSQQPHGAHHGHHHHSRSAPPPQPAATDPASSAPPDGVDIRV